ncbi:unnamed protein product, partial [Brenthis ino]
MHRTPPKTSKVGTASSSIPPSRTKGTEVEKRTMEESGTTAPGSVSTKAQGAPVTPKAKIGKKDKEGPKEGKLIQAHSPMTATQRYRVQGAQEMENLVETVIQGSGNLKRDFKISLQRVKAWIQKLARDPESISEVATARRGTGGPVGGVEVGTNTDLAPTAPLDPNRAQVPVEKIDELTRLLLENTECTRALGEKMMKYNDAMETHQRSYANVAAVAPQQADYS